MQNTPNLLERWKMGDPSVLNLAEFYPQTEALGPGKRAVIWVQGCALRCPGCVSPSYRPFRPATLIEAEDLAARILLNPDIDGLTISGGEPVNQCIGLTRVIDLLHARRPELTILSFSGYTLEALQHNSDIPGIAAYLSRLDCLIDGPYLQAQDNGLTGLRGSSNQKIHYFTPRLREYALDQVDRKAEIIIRDENLVFVGIPSRRFITAIDIALRAVNHIPQKLVQDVRA